MKPIAIAILLLLACAPIAIAQDKDKSDSATANPIVVTVRQMEQRFSKNLTGAADEMPAAKYSYKPTADQITFGHLMVHTASTNNGLCSAIAGTAAPDTKLSETDSKDVLTKALQDSFTYCEQVLAKADDSTLGQPVTLSGGRTSTRGGALVILASSWADHYSAAAMYLRLNDLLPPSAKKPAGK
jgi:DinB superfamily